MSLTDGDPPAWWSSVDPDEVISRPQVRDRIAEAGRDAPVRIDAETFLHRAAPLTGVLSGAEMVATAGRASERYSRWGVRKRRQSTGEFPAPPGRLIAAALAGMARAGVSPTATERTSDGCALNGEIPSSARTFGGTLLVAITVGASASRVDVEVVFPGQLVDWGEGRRVIRVVLAELETA